MALVREIEPPLAGDADERPPPEAWEALIEAAFAAPVPAYDGRPMCGVVLPRREHG